MWTNRPFDNRGVVNEVNECMQQIKLLVACILKEPCSKSLVNAFLIELSKMEKEVRLMNLKVQKMQTNQSQLKQCLDKEKAKGREYVKEMQTMNSNLHHATLKLRVRNSFKNARNAQVQVNFPMDVLSSGWTKNRTSPSSIPFSKEELFRIIQELQQKNDELTATLQEEDESSFDDARSGAMSKQCEAETFSLRSSPSMAEYKDFPELRNLSATSESSEEYESVFNYVKEFEMLQHTMRQRHESVQKKIDKYAQFLEIRNPPFIG